MNNLRNIIRQTLSEAFKRKHYTTWKNLVSEDSAEIEHTVTDIVAKVTKQLGITKYALAGSGTQGYAYYIPNNRILKITTDRSEPVESKKIQGKNCKHLANVYNVFTLKGTYDGIYVIISELLYHDLEKIENCQYFLEEFMGSIGMHKNSYRMFTRFQNNILHKDDMDRIGSQIMSYFESKNEKQKGESVLWYFKSMVALIEELRKNNIKTVDYVMVNLGLKKNGDLAMYDFGYSPEQDHNDNILHIDEEAENMSRMDYPDFLDTQYNPNMENLPYPPMTNPNKAQMREVELSPEELNKKNLPLQHHNLWSEFLESNTEALSDILPTLRRQYSNLETLQTVKDVEKDNPALYDEFAEWIFQTIKLSRQS